MTKMTHMRLVATLCAVVMIMTLAACGGTKPTPEDEQPVDPSQIVQMTFENPLKNPFTPPEVGELTTGAPAPKQLEESLKTQVDTNADAKGWLYVPHSAINDAVLHATDNDYYLRRDNAKAYNWFGCYFADFRTKFGTTEELSRNVVIYGHSMDDNPDGLKFSQLKKYLDVEYAKANPYIYFTSGGKDYMYKVFAVFYTDVHFNYIEPNPTDKGFLNIVNEAKKRSQYNYPDVDVVAGDKIITLSTCTYIYGKNNQRYVVMARMVRPGEAIPDTANVVKNPSPKAPQF